MTLTEHGVEGAAVGWGVGSDCSFYGNATLKKESQPCSSFYKMGIYVLYSLEGS